MKRRLRRIGVGEGFRLPDAPHCPKCRALLDGCTAATGSTNDRCTVAELKADADRTRPTPGTITLCAYCGSVLRFASNMELELANADDADPAVRDVYRKLQREIWKARN